MVFLQKVWEILSRNHVFFEILALSLILALALTIIWNIKGLKKFGDFIENAKNAKKILLVLFLFGFIFYSLFQIANFYRLGAPMRDVGIFDQAIWHLSHFHLPSSSLRGISNLWGDHFNPIIILLVPFYWIKSDVRWLFIVQSLVVALGVFPICEIAKDKLKSNLAGLAFAFSWLFYIGTQHALAFGFYPETLAITFLAYAIFFLFKKKIFFYFVCLILALTCKENISLYIAFLGLWSLIFTSEKIVGLVSVVLGALWFRGTMYLIPHLVNSPYIYLRYDSFGSNPSEIIINVFKHPINVLKMLVSPSVKVESWFYYLTPFAFLSLFSTFAIVLIPVFFEKFLSTDQSFWVMGFHYGASAVTLLTIAAIFTVERISKIKISFFKKYAVVFISILVVVLTFAFLIKSGSPIRQSFKNKWRFGFEKNYRKAIKLIPKDASLTAQMTLGTAIAHRDNLYWWSDYPEQKKGEYILLSSHYATFPYSESGHLGRIKALFASGEYGVLYSEGDILLLKKGLNSSAPLAEEMSDFLKKE